MSGFDTLPHDEQLRRLHLLATAALDRYDLPDGAEAHLINVSENATYRIDAPGEANKWALRVHREATTPETGSPPSWHGSRRCDATAQCDADADCRRRRRADPARLP